jgi:hypothetical protein
MPTVQDKAKLDGSGCVMFAFAGKHASYGAAGAAQSTFPPALASRGEAKAAHAAARRLRA